MNMRPGGVRWLRMNGRNHITRFKLFTINKGLLLVIAPFSVDKVGIYTPTTGSIGKRSIKIAQKNDALPIRIYRRIRIEHDEITITSPSNKISPTVGRSIQICIIHAKIDALVIMASFRSRRSGKLTAISNGIPCIEKRLARCICLSDIRGKGSASCCKKQKAENDSRNRFKQL